MSQIIHGFQLHESKKITELNLDASLYRHLKTGAELLSIEIGDENKAFAVTFRTPPEDSTGIAHIMEHSVLCGSRKYPVKEPFIELVKGSIKTFLNAMTYPDRTCYPVASTNLQDFYNLIDVYLDAVFYPLIPPHILEQEGWHYELEDPGDPIIFKGVVYNEMKGNYSSPDNMLGKYSMQSLFPGNVYRYDSGGDPKEIPELTYQQFKAFHEKFYHPSNARFYFYGDDDPLERLRIIDGYLKDFDPLEVDSGVSLQTKFEEPRRFSFPYDAGDEAANQKAMVTVNWLLPETKNRAVTLALGILTHILIGTPASPLRKRLIDSGLGEDLAGSGLENQLRQMFFSTGLKGVEAEDLEEVERLILETLKELAEDGISFETIEASLNTIEFRLRENNTGRFPRGLALMLRSLTTWLYEGDPFEPLAFEIPLNNIKKRVESGELFFEHLIEKHFLANTHRTTVFLKPDSELRTREEAAERRHLVAVKSKLNKAEIHRIIEKTQTLKRIQEKPDSPEDLAKIPKLTLEDLEREITKIPRESIQKDEISILYHDLFTNGIVYFDLGFDLRVLPKHLLPYVSLFSKGLLEMGTETEDYVELTQRIGRQTGGIYPSRFTSPVRNRNELDTAAWLFLHGKSTVEQAGGMLAILRDILLTAKLDNKARFKQMVLNVKSKKESGLIPGGHGVVNTRLKSHFTEADWVAEQMGGLSNLILTRQLVDEVDNNWESVLEKLELIRSLLINQNNLVCNVTLDEENWLDFKPALFHMLTEIPNNPVTKTDWSFEKAEINEGLTAPAQVNYVGKGGNLYDMGYEQHGSVFVIGKYLRTSWLWEKIRVQGGAYGAFQTFNRHSGIYTFVTYRDPNLLKTLDNFDGASQFLRQLVLTKDELTKAIIGVISDLDPYQLPDAKGFSSLVRYLSGVTDEDRQRIRDEVLSTSQEDFRRFADVLEAFNDSAHVVVLGSTEAIEAADKEKGGGWFKMKKVL